MIQAKLRQISALINFFKSQDITLRKHPKLRTMKKILHQIAKINKIKRITKNLNK